VTRSRQRTCWRPSSTARRRTSFRRSSSPPPPTTRSATRPPAEAAVERALELAEPDGLILPFTLAPVRGLLERHPRHRSTHATLLSDIHDVLAGSSPSQRHGEPAHALDELNDAELRVLRYLPTNLKAPEIAAELHVSILTVKTHLRHSYAKLDAHNRGRAVDRARELGLLAPSSRLR
jgi:LuxR family maltose regulon positive regulatory protein